MKTNKVILNGQTLIDLTQDNAVASDVRTGKTFHLASGEVATGTYEGVVPAHELNISENGMYDVTNFAWANVVVPNQVEVSVMPTPSASIVGCVYKYTGQTTGDYENGCYYVVVDDTEANN